MTVETRRDDCCATISLSGELDLSTVGELDRQLNKLTWRDPPEHLLLDVSGLKFVDSTGFAAFLRAYEAVEGNLGLVGESASLSSRLRLIGSWHEFLSFPDSARAIAHFHAA